MKNNCKLCGGKYDFRMVKISARLWGARTGNCNILKCITCMDNGEVHTSTFNEYGEMNTYEHGVFDIKKAILKELLDIKRKKVNDKIMNS